MHHRSMYHRRGGQRSERRSLVKGFYEALANPSTESLSPFVSDSFKVTDARGTRNLEGFVKFIGAFSDGLESVEIRPSGLIAKSRDFVALRVSEFGTPKTGVFFGVEVDGVKSYQVDGIHVLSFVDGKIDRLDMAMDWSMLAESLSAS